MMIGNSMGVIASAGMGVAQKLVGFIMLIPLSFSQSCAVFVAQNYGAKKYDRANKAFKISALISIVILMIIFMRKKYLIMFLLCSMPEMNFVHSREKV